MSIRVLRLFIDDNNQIWAEDQANKIAYRLQHAVSSANYPPAPTAHPAGKEPAYLSLCSEDQAFKTELAIDPLGGDLMAKNIIGPNAGKSVNLTYGQWREL